MPINTFDKGKKSNLKLRATSSVILWTLVCLVFYIGNTALFAVGICVFALVGVFEFSIILKNRLSFGTKIFVYVSVIFYYCINYYFLQRISLNNFFIYEVLFLLFSFFVITIIVLAKKNCTSQDRFSEILFAFFVILYLGFFLGFVYKIVHLPEKQFRYIFLCIMIAKFTDMFAYLFGSMFGKKKCFPQISPAKTWEGLFGGVFLTTLSVAIIYLIFSTQLGLLSWKFVFFFVPILCIFAIIGDLFESVYKRAMEVKDSSTVLPGIGGILDLVDSVCFVAPLVFFYLYLS